MRFYWTNHEEVLFLTEELPAKIAERKWDGAQTYRNYISCLKLRENFWHNYDAELILKTAKEMLDLYETPPQ